jgi:hypothetical protein
VKLFSSCVCVVLAAALTTPAMGQKAEKAKPQKARQAANPLVKAVQELELSDEQKAKVDAASKEYTESMAALRKQGLTPQLTKKRTDAVKAARESGKKGANLANDVLATLDISDEQKALLKQASEVQTKLQRSLAAALTSEQIGKMPKQMKSTLTKASSTAKKAK